MNKRILHWLRDNSVFLAAHIHRLYFLLIRVKIEGWDEVERHMARGPVIFGHLHGDDLAMLKPFSRRGLTVMVSLSKDGEALAKAMGVVGFETVRGSSSRRGREALKDMEELVRAGKSVIFTVDGPSGPRAKVKPGLIVLAKKTQAPIFVGVAYPQAGFLFRNSWHQTYLPYPLTKLRFRMVGPFHIGPQAGQEEFQALTERLEKALAPSGLAGKQDRDN